jgi:hypothetical protein
MYARALYPGEWVHGRSPAAVYQVAAGPGAARSRRPGFDGQGGQTTMKIRRKISMFLVTQGLSTGPITSFMAEGPPWAQRKANCETCPGMVPSELTSRAAREPLKCLKAACSIVPLGEATLDRSPHTPLSRHLTMSTNPNCKKTEREELEKLVAQFSGKVSRVVPPKEAPHSYARLAADF